MGEITRFRRRAVTMRNGTKSKKLENCKLDPAQMFHNKRFSAELFYITNMSHTNFTYQKMVYFERSTYLLTLESQCSQVIIKILNASTLIPF